MEIGSILQMKPKNDIFFVHILLLLILPEFFRELMNLHNSLELESIPGHHTFIRSIKILGEGQNWLLERWRA